MVMQMWESGDQIVLREVYEKRLWTITPVTVVEDKPDLVVLYTAAGTIRKRPVDKNGDFLRLPTQDWHLADEIYESDSLRLTIPGAYYSVLLFWTKPQREFIGWYINSEDPLQRTHDGFDYLDQILDVVISPDKREWHWKDEDELLEALDQGLVSVEKMAMLRREGERALEWVIAGRPPFESRWERWTPDSNWTVPKLLGQVRGAGAASRISAVDDSCSTKVRID